MIRTATSRFRCGRRPASNFPACPFPGQNGKVVFVSSRTTGPGVDNPTGDGEIFTAYPDGTNLTQLTFNTANDLDPTYSPDGKRIAFETNRDGNFEIYKMRAADGASRINVSRQPGQRSHPRVLAKRRMDSVLIQSERQQRGLQDDRLGLQTGQRFR